MTMKLCRYALVFIFCVSCQSSSGNENVYEHPSLGLSIVKPDMWKYLNPNEVRARISGTKLEDPSIQAIIQVCMAPPLLEIVKDNGQPIQPKLSITMNPMRSGSSSPVDLIKQASKSAPTAFKDYKIVKPPTEIEIAGQNASYMKAHYTGQFMADSRT